MISVPTVDEPNSEYSLPRDLPLLPPSVEASVLPEKLRNGDRPLPLEEARKTYVRLERSNWRREEGKSRHLHYKKNVYPRILDADRLFQENFDLTIVRLSRYISGWANTDSGSSFSSPLTLWELDQMLNSESVIKRIRRSLNYHLEIKLGLEYEWVAVTSVSPLTGVPREHICMWIDDPNDEVSTDDISPALEKHLDGCETAHRDDHKYRENGSGGAIAVEHTPNLVDHIPERFFEIQSESESEPRPNTKQAQFVAKELIHLPVGDYANSEKSDPSIFKLEGATLAWATSHHWFRTSEGFPTW